ncbi:acetoacetate decarboxylase family protein [Bradyrhizobium sp. 1.29L]
MPEKFDPARLYQRLPYGTTVPSQCLGQTDISFDCRVDPTWLAKNLADTPFRPVGDRIQISATDFRKNKVVPFIDVMVIAPVEYNGQLGGHPLIEFETSNRLVLGGREKWGYPKLVADISFDMQDDGSADVKVTLGRQEIMTLAWKPGDVPVSLQTPLKLAPHYLLRMLPKADKPGMSFVELLKRDTSPDYEMLEQKLGKGSVKLGQWPQHEWDYCDLSGLEVKEILAAKRTIANWHATETNGWASPVEGLL